MHDWVAKMGETAFETQAAFVTREMGEEAFSFEHESLEDLGRNARLRLYTHFICISIS